ncbi:MAG: TIGR03943 family protein [Chloroflexota bacterium]|jgi:putative membrane protein
MERLLKTIILILLGALLFMRVINGTVLYYISERFVMLTWLAAGGFFLVGASYYLVSGRHNHDHDHDHGHLTWTGLLIISLPILLGWLVPPQPLGAAAMSNREISIGSLSSVAPPKLGEAKEILAGDKNILDWLGDFQQAGDPKAFDGEEATIIGFVYRDNRFTDEQFMVARFTVSCCVADAAPIGLVVDWTDAPGLPSDQWVEVRGHFEAREFDGVMLPVLVADEIVLIDPPAQPYLYI